MNQVVRRLRRTTAGLAGALAGAALAATAAYLAFELPAAGLLGSDAIRVSPADGTSGAAAGDPLRVRVARGRLESVTAVRVQDARPHRIAGRVSADGRDWSPIGERLLPAARYTVDAVAADGNGGRVARHATFTTAVPRGRFVAYPTPQNRALVGTGMIVSLEFNRAIADRAAVERAVRVTARPSVPVAAHWFGRSRLDLRPERYWRPGTRVTVDLRFQGVRAAPGVYGVQRRRVSFTVGRSQVSRVDAAAHTLRVRRGGRLSTVPITAGAGRNATYNGKMVVSEMLEVTRMDGATVGFGGEYDIQDVPHAMRLTASGTFLHGNYWSRDVFGRANVSHGCVGLRDVRGGGSGTPAGWFFDRSLIGDVVEVVNSPDRVVAPDNGLSGWNMAWDRWRRGSALR